MTSFVETAKDAVRIYAREILSAFEAQRQVVTIKGDTSPVTETDLAAERAMRALISKRHPDHAIFGEENGQVDGSDAATVYRWILDPIDGTSNLAHGIPMFLAAAALMQGSEVVAGALYSPTSERLWWAAKGQGAYINGERLTLTPPPPLELALISYTRTRPDRAHIMQAMNALDASIGAPRIFGSGLWSMIQVASGHVDAHVGITPHLYDIAPGLLIAREAGAVATDFAGQPWQPGTHELMIAHPDLAAQLATILKE